MPDAGEIRAYFSDVVPVYDFLNHLLSFNVDRRWRAAMVREADPRPGDRVLDVCAGTADVAILLARRMERGRVVGVDFSEGMLERGREKAARRGLDGRVELLRADALCLPFADGSFDLLTIAFGLRNLTDRPAALREMVRVLRPGGRMVILEFAPPGEGWFGRLYTWYLGRVLPAVGAAVSGSGPTYRHLHDSIVAFMKPEELREAMEEAGLAEVTWRRLSGGIAFIHRGIRCH